MAEKILTTDLCVVGGGMAGICAALAAARHNCEVVLVHDRPVLGGNASSEIRVHIQGASCHGSRKEARETGIIEELQLENVFRNPQRSFSMWDLVLYEKVKSEPNLTLLLNTSVLEASVEGDAIRSVTGWQLTTGIRFTIDATLFADCSGDGVLAPLTGALFRKGREARSEYDEPAAPEVADEKTMGMSCLFGAKDTGYPAPFQPPSWAYDFPTDADLGRGGHDWLEMGYWWVELGGDRDSISDTEAVRDELLRVVMGLWDHIKNHGDHGAENWVLDWIQFLPGKRESRRFLGDYVLTQNDIVAGGRFEDTVAYGGWPMDLHPPGGFFAKEEPPCINHPVPDLYGIPFRSLYSRNINNLLFAGRQISATHVAIGSTRVMGTCGVLGQALGTASALAVSEGLSPRQVGRTRTTELQRTLLADDCYLPGFRQEPTALMAAARLTASNARDPQPLRGGVTRPVGGEENCWRGGMGDWVEYRWLELEAVNEVRISFDSQLNREIGMTYHGPYGKDVPTSPPPELVRDFRVEAEEAGVWRTLAEIRDNHQRSVCVKLDTTGHAVRLTLEATHGVEEARVFRFDVA